MLLSEIATMERKMKDTQCLIITVKNAMRNADIWHLQKHNEVEKNNW